MERSGDDADGTCTADIIESAGEPETVAALPGGFDTVHAIRLGIGAIRRVGGQLGGVERVPSRFSLFLPSDSQIGPGNRAKVMYNQAISGPSPLLSVA